MEKKETFLIAQSVQLAISIWLLVRMDGCFALVRFLSVCVNIANINHASNIQTEGSCVLASCWVKGLLGFKLMLPVDGLGITAYVSAVITCKR